MAQKPSIPKGTRDFGPLEMSRRNYIFNTIKKHFHNFGFQCIETPATENLTTLMGKYGDEGDKLLFKILNSGDFMKGVSETALQENNLPKLTKMMCEKGLRYDLTVPFARFVVQHRSELQLPFKRYQIQPVWRADRPQKGRYREFYQCDADIVGSDSLLNEVDLLCLIDSVFADLKVNIAIKLNNRKILSGLSTLIEAPDKLVEITTAIDKIDKIGLDAVCLELTDKGIVDEQINLLKPILSLEGTNADKLAVLKNCLKDIPEGLLGINELEFVVNAFNSLGHHARIDLDFSLARGLNYYTGTIIEVKALDVEIGSISGGGRYDNLTGVFGMPGISGVGISFGADRIYDVLNSLELYPEELSGGCEVMFMNFGEKEALHSMKLIKRLREKGISSSIYPDAAKMKKQMTYANQQQVKYVVMIGESELHNNQVTVKNMLSGDQHTIPTDTLIDFFT